MKHPLKITPVGKADGVTGSHSAAKNKTVSFNQAEIKIIRGKLSQIGVTSCGGKVPRHMTLDPTERWLLVANQASDNIAVIQRDTNSGKLAETGNSFPLVKPQCLVFV